jgi:hypothetical protein
MTEQPRSIADVAGVRDVAAWETNPAVCHVHFLNGDTFQFSPTTPLLALEEVKRHIQKVKGHPIRQQDVFPIPSTIPAGHAWEPGGDGGDGGGEDVVDANRGGAIRRLAPGQTAVYQCNILPPQPDSPITLQIDQGSHDAHVDTPVFATIRELSDTLKDMAELAAVYSWCGWEKQAMEIAKPPALTPGWKFQVRMCDIVGISKPFQVDFEYSQEEDPDAGHGTVRLDFATSQASHTAIVLILRMLDTGGTQLFSESPVLERIRKSFRAHLTSKRMRARRRRNAVVAAVAAASPTRDEGEDEDEAVGEDVAECLGATESSRTNPCNSVNVHQQEVQETVQMQTVFVRGRDFTSFGDLIYDSVPFREACREHTKASVEAWEAGEAV